ncbi:hypothetical protein [Thiolapillus sp.]|uniref:hypothetical protein n=1 Tax=Thiolapillus sp. TaxID=2017437 RepID=UPI0025D8687A|nr:hypothetical protein [Thiolapillus sp.]
MNPATRIAPLINMNTMAANKARRKPRLLLLGLNFSIADMLLKKGTSLPCLG